MYKNSQNDLKLDVTIFLNLEQEDCQELLSYLLDMIHEDLNRCLKKQPILEKDYIGDIPKDEWAAESWGEHLKINKSIVVDLF